MSNPKLFLFCIGGTGARTLKALTFLMASGVEIKASKIVPIIIDPDSANGDVQRVTEILDNYQNIRKRLEFDKNKFFKTEIQTLASLQAEGDKSNLKVSDGFRFDIDGTRDGVFKDFIGLDTMSETSREMVKLLFSEANLNMGLEVGFKGNPHMGSVVLNQFEQADEFKYFASRFAEGDRIMIIGSIFGGTGAAGLPLLVKNIREAEDNLPNHDRLKNAAIAAITVKPYFAIEPDANVVIDSNTFITKTKSALEYYADNLSGNNSLNIHYYIGDTANKAYKASEGKATQKNDAHAVELFSALAAIDFMNHDNSGVECKEGKAVKPLYKEYGIQGDTPKISHSNLGSTSKQWILKPMAQYALALNFWKNELRGAINKPENWTKNKSEPITSQFLTSDFYANNLDVFNNRYREWLTEMARNTRSFDAFDVDSAYLHNFIKGFTPMKKNLIGRESPSEVTFSDYNYELNAVETQIATLGVEKRFMAIFTMATERILNDKFKSLFN
jgi:hypothetical protein